jgi:hypothetical protein
MGTASRSSDCRRRPWSLLALTMAAVLISGCGPSSPPDPLSVSAVEARSERMQQMSSALHEVVATFDGDLLGEALIDECYEGQRNYKVDTGYDYRCSLLMSVLISIDGDFRTHMLDADAALSDLGWQSRDGEWPGQLVDDYWDLRASESLDGQVRLSRLPSPLSLMRDELRLLFDYSDVADDQGLERINRGQQSTLWCCGLAFFERKELIDADQVAGAAPHDYLVLVKIEGHYLEK